MTEGTRIDAEQNALALLDRVRMGGKIGRRIDALGSDLSDGAEPAVGDLLLHHRKRLLAFARKCGGRIAHHQLCNPLGMIERERQRQRAAKAVADQDGVLGDAELLKPVLDASDIGVEQRRHHRLRTVEARQIDQGDAMFRRKGRQNRVEGVAVGKQRMQQDDVAALPGLDRGKDAVAGAKLLQVHGAASHVSKHIRPRSFQLRLSRRCLSCERISPKTINKGGRPTCRSEKSSL